MISKGRQEIANILGMSEKTYREWSKLSSKLLEYEKNIGVELFSEFTKAIDKIEKNKKIMASYSDLGQVVTLPLNKQIEIANKFIENPTHMREIWKEYFTQNIKITIEVSENTNNLLTLQAKEKGLSKAEYTSQLLILMTRVLKEDNEN